MQTDSALGKRFSASGRDVLCNPKIFFSILFGEDLKIG